MQSAQRNTMKISPGAEQKPSRRSLKAGASRQTAFTSMAKARANRSPIMPLAMVARKTAVSRWKWSVHGQGTESHRTLSSKVGPHARERIESCRAPGPGYRFQRCIPGCPGEGCSGGFGLHAACPRNGHGVIAMARPAREGSGVSAENESSTSRYFNLLMAGMRDAAF